MQDFATIHSSETTSLRISTATTSQDWQRQARWFHRCGTEDENGNSGYTTAVLRCGLVFLQKYIPPKKIRTPCVIICLSVIVFFKDQGLLYHLTIKLMTRNYFGTCSWITTELGGCKTAAAWGCSSCETPMNCRKRAGRKGYLTSKRGNFTI